MAGLLLGLFAGARAAQGLWCLGRVRWSTLVFSGSLVSQAEHPASVTQYQRR